MTEAAEQQKVPVLNVPNVLTTLRIVLVPFFGWALLTHHGQHDWWRIVAFWVFFVAMITDKIDGDLARKHNLVTDFGKIADPIADKAITGMAFIGLSIVGEIWWWVTIVVLVREWGVTLLRLVVVNKVVLAARDLGKLKTLVQGLALGGLCLPFRNDALAAWFHTSGTVVHVVFELLLAVAVGLTVWSGAEFFWGLWRQRGSLRASQR